jgi:hypothetical protein
MSNIEKIAKFVQAAKRVDLEIKDDNVKSIGYDGRAWSFVVSNGMRNSYTDERKFKYQLSQELKNSQKAYKFIEQLETKFNYS